MASWMIYVADPALAVNNGFELATVMAYGVLVSIGFEKG